MLLRTGRIDCKYKNKTSKENAVLIKIITLYLNIWTQKTSVNRLGNISHSVTSKIIAYSDEHGSSRNSAASSSCLTGVRVKAQYCHLEVNQVLALEYFFFFWLFMAAGKQTEWCIRWSIYMWCYHKSPVHFKYCGYRQYRYIVTH